MGQKEHTWMHWRQPQSLNQHPQHVERSSLSHWPILMVQHIMLFFAIMYAISPHSLIEAYLATSNYYLSSLSACC